MVEIIYRVGGKFLSGHRRQLNGEKVGDKILIEFPEFPDVGTYKIVGLEFIHGGMAIKVDGTVFVEPVIMVLEPVLASMPVTSAVRMIVYWLVKEVNLRLSDIPYGNESAGMLLHITQGELTGDYTIQSVEPVHGPLPVEGQVVMNPYILVIKKT